MPRLLPAIAVLLLGLPARPQVAAPTNSQSSPDDSPPPCTVSGRVLTATDGAPLKSTWVVLKAAHSGSHDQAFATTSDTDGHFTIRDVPAGRYEFFANHAGFVEQHYKAGPDNKGPLFSLTAGDKITDTVFRMIPAGVITGRVTDEDGEVMQRVKVIALRLPRSEDTDDDASARPQKRHLQTVSATQTDDRGMYRIFGLKPVDYYVKVDDSSASGGGVPIQDEIVWVKRTLGSGYSPTYYPGVTQFSQAQGISIKAGDEVQADVMLRKTKVVNIAGRVTGDHGPAADAIVELHLGDGDDYPFGRSDQTDEKGNFQFHNVPEGSYSITAYQREDGGRAYESRVREKLEVGAENIDSLVLSLGGGTTVQGRIRVDSSIPVDFDRVSVSLSPVEDEDSLGRHADIKKDGGFEIKSVQDGDYALNLAGLENGTYVKSIRYGAEDVLEKGVQLERGGAPGKIEVVIASGVAELQGSVTDDDGPVIGAAVRLAPDPLTPYNRLRIRHTTTDQLGHFSWTDLAPGKYRVAAKLTVTPDSPPSKSEPQSVTINNNDHKAVQMNLIKPQE